MRNFIIFFIAVFLNYTVGFAQQEKHVLFIGNSYTYANNLPLMLSALATSTEDKIITESNTGGGLTLQNHSTNAATISKIQQGIWDYVVLQEQSQLPSFPMSQVATQTFPYAKILCDTIRHYNNCAEPLFFMTWGRENGDASNCASWPPVCTYEGMDSLLNLRYRMMADSNHALVSPVGAVWNYIRNNNPNIDLYSPDESHPSLAGSYVAACTFYTMILEKNPVLISDNYGLSSTDANIIRNATRIVAFDSLSKWNVDKFNPIADFSVIASMDTIVTINKSKYADTYLWNFGDGDTSILFEPSHIYSNAQNYNITLKSSKCGMENIADTTITVLINTIKLSKGNDISIYPNPANDYFILKSKNIINAKNITIFSIDGKLIKEFSPFTASVHKFDISSLNTGVYILSMIVDGEEIRLKLIK